MDIILLLVIFFVATIVGYKVISSVPSLLHTPLMSGMNALSGITILGSLIATAGAISFGFKALGFLAIVLATINIVSGFVVTDRMLKMFNKQT